MLKLKNTYSQIKFTGDNKIIHMAQIYDGISPLLFDRDKHNYLSRARGFARDQSLNPIILIIK